MLLYEKGKSISQSRRKNHIVVYPKPNKQTAQIAKGKKTIKNGEKLKLIEPEVKDSATTQKSIREGQNPRATHRESNPKEAHSDREETQRKYHKRMSSPKRQKSRKNKIKIQHKRAG